MIILTKTKNEHFVTSLSKHHEILLTRTEVFMIIKKYHLINYVRKNQSILLFKNHYNLIF
jgi:hypothetical protein